MKDLIRSKSMVFSEAEIDNSLFLGMQEDRLVDWVENLHSLWVGTVLLRTLFPLMNFIQSLRLEYSCSDLSFLLLQKAIENRFYFLLLQLIAYYCC